MELAELKSIFKRLSAECICTVCLGPLYSPVSVCTTGHGVCAECLPRLQHCPLCKASFTFQSVLLNSMLELLPRCCTYNGCETFVKPGDGHEGWCGFKPMTCKIQGGTCLWRSCGNDFINHVNADHTQDIWQSDDLCWFYLSNYKCRGFEMPFKALDRLFLIRGSFDYEGDRLIVTFILVPNGTEIKSTIQIVFQMGDKEKSHISTMIRLKPENWLRETNSMIFTRRILKNFRNEENLIPLGCQMETLPNETVCDYVVTNLIIV